MTTNDHPHIKQIRTITTASNSCGPPQKRSLLTVTRNAEEDCL